MLQTKVIASEALSEHFSQSVAISEQIAGHLLDKLALELFHLCHHVVLALALLAHGAPAGTLVYARGHLVVGGGSIVALLAFVERVACLMHVVR